MPRVAPEMHFCQPSSLFAGLLREHVRAEQEVLLRRAVRPRTSPRELRSVPGFCNFPSFKMDFETVAKKRR